MEPYISILLPVLIAALIGIRVYEVRNKQMAVNSEYNKFKDAIWPFLHSILSDSGNLNSELLQHFPSHKNAAREFIGNLKGKNKKQFNKLWMAYESEYLQVKSLGVFAPAVAIAPSEVDLRSKPNSSEMENWEIDRVNKITSLLNALLKTAKVQIWF